MNIFDNNIPKNITKSIYEFNNFLILFPNTVFNVQTTINKIYYKTSIYNIIEVIHNTLNIFNNSTIIVV